MIIHAFIYQYVYFSYFRENEVSVTATVVEHTKLKKVVVFKKKRRKNYKRTKGM